jgi:hypothetical protein
VPTLAWRAVAAALFTLLLAAMPAQAAQNQRLRELRTDRPAAERALTKVQRLLRGEGVRTGRELTPALLSLKKRRAALDAADRRAANRIFSRPTDPGDDDEYTGNLAPPVCGTHFCIHYVTTTEDAPNLADGADANSTPDYVDFMLGAFEHSFATENGTLGWRLPVSDGTRGGNSRTDVYIAQIGDDDIFGYANTDPQADSRSQFGYLVMDDDYAVGEFGYPSFEDPLEVTAAHEYNHVLQFGYDILQDGWMFESTATWAEDKVFNAVNDYVNYIPDWADEPEQPLTEASDLKQYGSAIWNHWLDTRYEAQVVRRAWAVSVANSVAGGGFAPGAYDRAIRDSCGPGFAYEFEEFTASVAEWSAANSGIHEGATFPVEVDRNGTLAVNGAAATGTVDHTAFALYDVPIPSASRLYLTGGLPPTTSGAAGSIALVGMVNGTMTKRLGILDANGRVTVALDNPGQFDRITAVITNADTSHAGFGTSDWLWTKDARAFTLTATTAAPSEPLAAPLPAFTPCNPDATTPPPPPPPPPPVAPPPPPPPVNDPAKLDLSRGSLPRLGRLGRKGILTIRAKVNEAGTLRARVTVDRKTAKRLKVGRKRTNTIGSKRVTASRAGTFKIRVKLSKKARKGLRRQRRTLRMTVRTSFAPLDGGKTATDRLPLTLRP